MKGIKEFSSKNSKNFRDQTSNSFIQNGNSWDEHPTLDIPKIIQAKTSWETPGPVFDRYIFWGDLSNYRTSSTVAR